MARQRATELAWALPWCFHSEFMVILNKGRPICRPFSIGLSVGAIWHYLHKSTLLLNTKTGDMQLIKVKLAYFAKAYLMIQFSGTNSTQIFIVSDNKSVFYKGKQDKDVIIMTKCKEDDIVTE